MGMGVGRYGRRGGRGGGCRWRMGGGGRSRADGRWVRKKG